MRIAIVGCGYVADQYLAALPHHPSLELLGVFDRDASRLAAFARHHRVEAYASLDALLADASIDTVLNLTNPHSHFTVNEACLEAGKHVYSEKPLAMIAEEARTLVALAKQRRLHLSGAPSRLLGEPAQTMWKALRDGAIGTPRLVYAEMDDGPLHRMDFRDRRSASGAPWPYADELAVGCAVEHAGYALTWLAAFFGPAESVGTFSALVVPDKGNADITTDELAPDFSVACIRYRSGVVARLTSSILAPANHAIRVVGDDGVLSVDDCWRPDSPVHVAQHVHRGRWRSDPTRKQVKQLKDPELPRASRGQRKVDFCLGPRELAAAIREDRPSRLSADFCLHVTELVLAIDAARRGTTHAAIASTFAPVAPMPWAL